MAGTGLSQKKPSKNVVPPPLKKGAQDAPSLPKSQEPEQPVFARTPSKLTQTFARTIAEKFNQPQPLAPGTPPQPLPHLDKKFARLEDALLTTNSKLGSVEARLGNLETRIQNRMETRMENMETRITEIGEKIDCLGEMFGELIKSLQ